MYSLDINFLNDRPEFNKSGGPAPARRAAQASSSMLPLFLGLAVGVALPALTGGAWLFLQNQITSLETQQKDLEGQIASLEAKKKEADALQGQIKQVEDGTAALASVFGQLKPWSALLQDLRERIPTGVQVQTIQQADAAPPATPQLNISGVARSYTEVNDFILMLQKSPFLDATQIQLMGAQLQDNPTTIEFPKSGKAGAAKSEESELQVKLPQVVSYQIQAKLSTLSATDPVFLRELDRKGAVGLVTRIRTLQEKGVLK